MYCYVLIMQHSGKGILHGCLLDHHFHRIDAQAEHLTLGYGICDSAVAAGHLCVKVHPAARLRLCHQQNVHLTRARCVNTEIKFSVSYTNLNL